MCIYQFLIAVRQDGSQLTNEDGETTRWSNVQQNLLKLKKLCQYLLCIDNYHWAENFKENIPIATATFSPVISVKQSYLGK